MLKTTLGAPLAFSMSACQAALQVRANPKYGNFVQLCKETAHTATGLCCGSLKSELPISWLHVPGSIPCLKIINVQFFRKHMAVSKN